MKLMNNLILTAVALSIILGTTFYYVSNSEEMAPGDDTPNKELQVL